MLLGIVAVFVVAIWLMGFVGFVASLRIASWEWHRAVAAATCWPIAAGMVAAEAVARWDRSWEAVLQEAEAEESEPKRQ